MSRNGSGTFNLTAGNPVVTGTTISSTWANNTLSDIANGLTQSISADGQTPITGPLIGSSGTVAFGGVGQTQIPSGTTAQRAASPTDGMIRYNTDLQQYEGYKNGAWSIFGNGAGGTLFSDTITATQGQTLITMPTGYVLGGDNLSVYVNGSRQIYNVNYSETSTTSFTFSSGLNVGDLVNYTIGASTSLSVNAASVLYNEGGTGATNRNVEVKLQESVSVKDFGAVGDGTTDDTTAINDAIKSINANGGGTVIIPNGTYIVSANTVTGIATGVAGIVLLDNVNLVIEGTIKVKNNAYGSGAFYGAIRSLDVGLNNASITGTGIINGNSSNQVASVQCNNIYLTCSYNVVVSGINSLYSNGMGIQLVPVASSTHTACAVQNCFVNNCTNIGIQVAHGLYCSISGNRITTCTNNGIDIYGDNGTAIADDGFISITDNNIGGVLVGIFVETSSRVAVVGNTVGFSTTGIATNRVNGQPNTITISGNSISSCATGMFASGDSGSVLISNNSFSVFTTAGLQIGVAGGNISYVNAFGNVFSPTSTTTPVIYVTGVQASFNIIRQNYLTQGSHNSAYLIVNDATTNVTNTLELPMNNIVLQPVKQLYSGTSTSGGTATLTLPSNSSGKLVIKSTAGGAWYSVWSGSFASSLTGVSVSQDSTAFNTTGNNIVSVVAGGTTLVVTITFAASGSTGIWNAWIEYF